MIRIYAVDFPLLNYITSMNKSDYFKEYAGSTQKLKKECIDRGIDEEEFKKLYLETLETIDKNKIRNTRSRVYVKKRKLLLISVLLILTVCSFKYIYNNVLCNLQEFIYPGLRLIRKMSIPFISLFPALTGLLLLQYQDKKSYSMLYYIKRIQLFLQCKLSELYQEPCLIQNPFFTIVDMDCWPCSTVDNIHKVFDPQPVHQQHMAPFVYKVCSKSVTGN